MAAKLTLNPSPTFKHTVFIPIPGGDAEPVEFVFKGKSRKEYKTLMDGLADAKDKRSEAEKFMAFVDGWDIAADFTAENVTKFLDAYIGADSLVFSKYTQELTKALLGN